MQRLILVVTLMETVLQISQAALFDQSTLIADTTYGKLEGIDLGESYGFIGVPFAKPPVEPLRFSSPKPLEGWNGTYKADVFGTGCMQYCSEPWSSCPTLVSDQKRRFKLVRIASYNIQGRWSWTVRRGLGNTLLYHQIPV